MDCVNAADIVQAQALPGQSRNCVPLDDDDDDDLHHGYYGVHCAGLVDFPAVFF